MKKVITVLHSFEEAERADKEYYRRLSPEERLDILLELNRRWPHRDHVEAPEGFASVYRITKLS